MLIYSWLSLWFSCPILVRSRVQMASALLLRDLTSSSQWSSKRPRGTSFWISNWTSLMVFWYFISSSSHSRKLGSPFRNLSISASAYTMCSYIHSHHWRYVYQLTSFVISWLYLWKSSTCLVGAFIDSSSTWLTCSIPVAIRHDAMTVHA